MTLDLTPKTPVTDIKCQQVHGSDTASFPQKSHGHLHSTHRGRIPLTPRDTTSDFSWAGRQNLMSQCCLLLIDYCAVKQTSLYFLSVSCLHVSCVHLKFMSILPYCFVTLYGSLYVVCYINCKGFLLDWHLSFNFSNHGFHSIEVLKFHVIKNVQSFPLWFRDSRRTSPFKALRHSALWCFD